MLAQVIIYFVVPAVLAACWVFHHQWPKQSVRSLRDELFAIRDDLFQLGRSSPDLDFDDAVYGMLRSNINGYIRFAESITFWTMVGALRVKPPEGYVPWADRWEKLLQECPQQVRQRLEELHLRALSAICRHALRTSIVAVAVIRLKKLMQLFKAPLESVGEVYGEEHSIACRTSPAIA